MIEVMEAPRPPRPTYPQNWTAYNLAQTEEKVRVEKLLRELCAGVKQPAQAMGRPRLPLADVVFSMVMKVYVGFSARRATSDVRSCKDRGLIDADPHYNSVLRGFADKALTPVLLALVMESALPLKAVERQFAADSTGFGTTTYRRWFDEKYGRERKVGQWVKCHVMVGTLTHVVTAVEVTHSDVNDCPVLPDLAIVTAERFQMDEVSADKGYLSRDNATAIDDLGSILYVPMKVNSTHRGSPVWRRLYHLFHYKADEFAKHYHRRSNVETVFSMVKRKFGASVRSKTTVAQTNEVLAKILCHNLAVLVQSCFELDVEATFWAEEPAASEVKADARV